MQIQGLGLNTVIPTISGGRQVVAMQKADSVSFSGKEAVAKKPLIHHFKSLIKTLKEKSVRIESPIKLPKVEKFDELISRLDAQGTKYEIIPSTSRDYKRVKIYNSSSETPLHEYRFRGKGSLYSITKNNSKGEGLKKYIFKSNGSPSEIILYEPKLGKTRAYADFKRSEINVVTLNPHTNKYFEETGIYKYTNKGTWEEFHPEDGRKIAEHANFPRVK